MARYKHLDKATVGGVNAELEKIEQTQADMLSRKAGDTPNSMETDIDMNTHRILNLAEPLTQLEPLRKKDGEAVLAANKTAVAAAEDAQQALAQIEQYPEDSQLASALSTDTSNVLVGGQEAGDIGVPVGSLVDFIDVPFVEGRTYINSGFYPGETIGGGIWKAVSGADLTQNNGGTFVSKAALQAWYDAAVAAGGVTTANLQANLSTLFAAGTGTGDGFVRITKSEVLDIEWFGARRDTTNTVDSSLSFKKAFEVGKLEDFTVSGSGSYYLDSGGIKVEVSCDLSNTFLVTNAFYEDGIFELLPFVGSKVKFGSMRPTGDYHVGGSMWAYDNCAIKHVAGVISDRVVEFNDIRNYRYGLRIQPDDTNGNSWFSYNTVRGQSIRDCQYNLYIHPVNGGWVNQNLWDIRRLRNNSSSPDGWAIYTAKDYLTGGEVPAASPNENLFFHIALEGTGPNCIYSKNSKNSYLSCRFEARPANSIVIDESPSVGVQNIFDKSFGLRSDMFNIVSGNFPVIQGEQHVVRRELFSGVQKGDADVRSFKDSGFDIPHQTAIKNSLGAYCYAFGYLDRINSTIGGDGAYNVFIDNDTTRKYPGLSVCYFGGIPTLRFGDGFTDQSVRIFYSGGAFKHSANTLPSQDAAFSLGVTSLRWSEVYSATGTINTSDEREKQQIKDIEIAAIRAWSKVKFKQYKWNDAVDKKSTDGARLHFGVIAQEVKAAFESEGLDPFAYGLLCYDEWAAEDAVVESWEDEYDENDALVRKAGSKIIEEAKPAGSRYGVRYEECLALECAYLRAKLDGVL